MKFWYFYPKLLQFFCKCYTESIFASVAVSKIILTQKPKRDKILMRICRSDGGERRREYPL